MLCVCVWVCGWVVGWVRACVRVCAYVHTDIHYMFVVKAMMISNVIVIMQYVYSVLYGIMTC